MRVITIPFHGRQKASLAFETCSFFWVDSVIVGRQFLPPSFKEVFLINGQPQLKNNLPQSCQSYVSLNLSLLSCISLSLLLTNILQQAFWWLDKEALFKSLHENLQQRLIRSYYFPDCLTHSVTNIIKNTHAKSQSFYTCLLNKTWIAIGLTVKQRGIKNIKIFSYKKCLVYTEKQLPYL